MTIGGLEIPSKGEVSQKGRVTFVCVRACVCVCVCVCVCEWEGEEAEGYRTMENDPILELSFQSFTK